VLLDGGRRDDALPVPTITVASLVLLVILPWVV
jgi:hypothetical protein